MPKDSNKKIAVLAAIMAVSICATAMAENFIPVGKIENASAQSRSSHLISRGVFESRAGYRSTGEVFILQTPRDYVLVLSQDFSLGLSQSAVLAFGNNGKFIQGSQFADLRASSGRQTYILPKTFSPSYVSEIYIVSKASSNPLTMAALN